MKAKTKLTKLWSILLALVMVVGMLPTVALAAEPATATADFDVDPTTALDLLNAAKTGTTASTWDSSNNTLTLNGVNFETTAATAVKLPEGAKIVLAAGTTNTITGGDLAIGVSSWVECYGIYAEDGLTIEGTGKLTVTGGNATGSNENAMSYGIYAKSGEVSITGGTVEANGGTVTVTGNQTTISCGIGASENVTISSGVVTAIGGTVTSTDGKATGKSHGIFSRDVSISSPAIVIAKGGTTNNQSYGIYAVKGVTISGAVEATGDTVSSLYGTSCGIGASENVTISGTAVVSAKGGNATGVSGNSNGIYANINVTISGGTVSATGGTASSGNSYGIFAFQNVSIQDTADVTVDVTATGGKATNDNSYGIYANKNVTISGGTVSATGGNADYESYGIYATDGLTISGDAYVNATGGTVNESNGFISGFSYGIYAGSTLTISDDADVTANGGKARTSFGIRLQGSKIAIEGGTVNAVGGQAKAYSYGISASSVAISGGTVTATGGTATEHKSYGISASSVTISGGTFTAKANTSALSKAPSELPGAYQWRTSESGTYTASSNNGYAWDSAHTYVEIRDTAPAAATYTVTFDANGGTGTMADVSGVSGTYTLPENRFTAPVGMQFKCWSVGGIEKAVGATINVTANTTVTAVWKTIVTAVWETIPATSTEYDILDGANSSWTQNSDGSLSIRGSGAFSEFVGVKVDGKSVDEQYYTVKEGSTIVTLKAEYLSTLAAGPHTIQLIWKDGTASTTFNINVNNPNTGDNGGLALAAALLALSAAAIAASGFNRKRGKSSR